MLLAPLLESYRILKVGFGVANDRRPIYGKYGIKLKGALDLAPVVRRLGYRQRVGLQAAVAVVLGRRLGKSKTTQLSNRHPTPPSYRSHTDLLPSRPKAGVARTAPTW